MKKVQAIKQSKQRLDPSKPVQLHNKADEPTSFENTKFNGSEVDWLLIVMGHT